MNSAKPYLLLSFLLINLSITWQTATAQEIDLGADFVSRYVWRGADVGDAASIQPYIEFSAGGFTLGTWASYSISPASAGFNEHDLYVSYSYGPVSVGVTDYYFPNAAAPANEFFNYDNDGEGAHIIEPHISITGGEAFPLTFYAAITAYNDPDNSIYLEASIPFSVKQTTLRFTVGGTPAEGLYASDAAITNINLAATRTLKITDHFSLPLFGSYILNPYAEQSYLVFGLSL